MTLPAEDPEPSPVEALVAELFERLDAEGLGALDSICAAHPELADAVRERVHALQRFGMVAESSPEIPERIGRYRILRKLGEGGMGAVYLAESERTLTPVALKLIRPDQLYYEGVRGRFEREIEAVRRLAHDAVVPLYEVGQDSGVPYFTMEFVAGETLAEVLERVRDRPLGELTGGDFLGSTVDPATAADATIRELAGSTWVEACLRIVRQVAEALEHAHRHGVVHRDIKPSNIMLSRGGRVRVLDFGLAAAQGTTRLTRTGTLIGSLPYLAPEFLRNEPVPVGPSADVYSLGVTLYELLTLRCPFLEAQPDRTVQAILAGRAERPGRIHDGISREVDRVVAMAMEVDPGRRYATAADFAADLDRLLAHRPVRAQAASVAWHLRRFVRVHPAWSVVLLLGPLLLLALTGGAMAVAWQQYRHAGTERRLNEELSSALSHSRDNLHRAQEAIVRLLQRPVVERMRDVPGTQELCRDLLRDAVRLCEELLPTSAEDPELRMQLASNLIDLGMQYEQLGELDETARCYERALEIDEGLIAQFPDDPRHQRNRARHGVDLGILYGNRGEFESALRCQSESLAILRELQQRGPMDRDLREIHAGAAVNQAMYLSLLERPDEALAELQQIQPLAESLMRENPENPRLTLVGAASGVNQVLILVSEERFEEAEEVLNSLDLDDALARHPRSADLQDLRGVLEKLRADVFREFDDLELARDHYQEAADLYAGLRAAFPGAWEWQCNELSVLDSLAQVHGELGESEAAEACRTQLEAQARSLLRRFPDLPDVQQAARDHGIDVN